MPNKTIEISRDLLERSVSIPRNNAEFQAQVMVVEEIRALLAAPESVPQGAPEVVAFLHSDDGYMCDRWVDLRRDNSCNPRALILQDHHNAYVSRLKKELTK